MYLDKTSPRYVGGILEMLNVRLFRYWHDLPEALRNYLARLGWSHGDDELFTTEQMVEWFSLEALNKGAARFDFVKLESINGHYIREAHPGRLYEVMLSTAVENERSADVAGLEANRETVLKALRHNSAGVAEARA